MVYIKYSPLPVTFTTTKRIVEQMNRYVCQVLSPDNAFGTGFFCNLHLNNIIIPTLITCHHVIDVNELLPNGNIRIKTNEEEKIIQINENRLFYSNMEYDITIIEIKPEDHIEHFLEIDEGIFGESEYIKYNKNSIYLIHYPKGILSVSYGILQNCDIDDEIIEHLCNTQAGSTGAPILNLNTNKVLGIHISGGPRQKNYNVGRFLTKAILEFSKEIEYKKYNEYKSRAFTNLKLLSAGSYGEVYSAFNIINKTEICLKKINLEKMRLNYEENQLSDYLKDLNNEIKILKLLSDNKNSIKFYGTYDENNEKVIIMEKCDQNLQQFLKGRGKGMETEEIKRKFKELNQLFRLIQEKKIIHRDLKLENFSIKYTDNKKEEYIIKLCDYGIGIFKNQSNELFSGLKGSFDTVAPEILLLKTKTYENTLDIFSLGIILYQISHNLIHPFGNNFMQIGSVYNTNYEKDNFMIEFDKSIKNKDFIDLITKMIKLNPKNRLKWEEYFEHPFFK